MRKIDWRLIIFLGVILGGCVSKKEIKQEPANYAKAVQIANPASVYCEQNGGVLKLENGTQGQYGLCVFGDGSSCEEWSFFRKECVIGQSLVKYSWK